MTGIYPSTLTYVRFLEEDRVLQEKNVVVKQLFLQLGVGAEPWWTFKGQKGPNNFGFSISLRRLNGLQWH